MCIPYSNYRQNGFVARKKLSHGTSISTLRVSDVIILMFIQQTLSLADCPPVKE